MIALSGGGAYEMEERSMANWELWTFGHVDGSSATQVVLVLSGFCYIGCIMRSKGAAGYYGFEHLSLD